MKITVTWTSTNLPDLLGSDFAVLENAKSSKVARVSVQNTSTKNIYIENWKEATVDWGYKLAPEREVEMYIANLGKLYFIADNWDTAVRVITT